MNKSETTMPHANTTVLVVARERFTPFSDSLRSLFETVPREVPVIVVDCGAPAAICADLQRLQSQRYFEWIHTDYFLLPQEARYRALPLVKTPYVVFADNDLHYEAGWLEALENNALQNAADVVAPLICIGPPTARDIHHAGGEFIWRNQGGVKYLNEIHRLSDKQLSNDIDYDFLAPLENKGVEFHCFFSSMDCVRRIGTQDTRLVVSEHIDFVLRCLCHNLKITFEKNAVVTYQAKIPLKFKELSYFFFRWNLGRVSESLQIMQTFWGVNIQHPKIIEDWAIFHQQRAIKTLFPLWITRRVKIHRLRGFLKPWATFTEWRAEALRRGMSLEAVVESYDADTLKRLWTEILPSTPQEREEKSSAMDVTVPNYAQTNLQLYNQLLNSEHYSEADLLLIRKAYDFSASAFSGRFRGNGKPFICHLVGSASVMAKHQRSADEIAAALLHACYEQGTFLWGGIFPAKKGVSQVKRDLLMQTTNRAVERLVFTYDQKKWNKKTILYYLGESLQASDLLKQTFMMEIANEVDEFLDDGMSFCIKNKAWYDEESIQALRTVAERFDCISMVEELIILIKKYRHHKTPAVLISNKRGSINADFPILSIRQYIKSIMDR